MILFDDLLEYTLPASLLPPEALFLLLFRLFLLPSLPPLLFLLSSLGFGLGGPSPGIRHEKKFLSNLAIVLRLTLVRNVHLGSFSVPTPCIRIALDGRSGMQMSCNPTNSNLVGSLSNLDQGMDARKDAAVQEMTANPVYD